MTHHQLNRHRLAMRSARQEQRSAPITGRRFARQVPLSRVLTPIIATCLALLPGAVPRPMAAEPLPESAAPPAIMDGLADVIGGNEAAIRALPRATEFFRPGDRRIKIGGGRLSLRPLDLSRPPTEADLMAAGHFGGPLSPTRSADPAKLSDSAKRAAQESDNLAFGRAIQKWDEHAYPEAVEMFRQHRKDYPDSPWTGEAELHLGCFAQYGGRWDDARFSFEWILNNLPSDTEIWRKAKLRRAVLHYAQGELQSAADAFAEMLAAETADWGRRTYAHYWLRQLSFLRHHETALRTCGIRCIAEVLRIQGGAAAAAGIAGLPAAGDHGFSFGELEAFAIDHGLAARGVRVPGRRPGILPTPFIAHYSDRHFVTVTAIDPAAGAVTVFDPRIETRVVLAAGDFAAQWSGLALVLGAVSADQDSAMAAGAIVPATDDDRRSQFGGCCGVAEPPADSGCTADPCDCDDGGPAGGSGTGDRSGGGGCPGCGPRASYGLPTWTINPINLNVIVQDVPLWADAPYGPDPGVRLTYNSQNSLDAWRPVGNKWTLNFASYAMEYPATGDVLVVNTTGGYDRYVKSGSAYTSPAAAFATLVKTGPFAFDLTFRDGSVYRYGVPRSMPDGTASLLTSIEDRFGHAVSINHDADGNIDTVADAAGHTWQFSYTAAGQISRIADGTGRAAAFAYDANGNLLAQTDMGGTAYGYTYDEDAYLTSVILPNGTTRFRIEPPDDINNGSVGYPPPGGTMWENHRVTITDPLGLAEEYHWNGYSGNMWHRDKVQYQTGGPTDPWGPRTERDFVTIASRGATSWITYAANTADATTVAYDNFTAARQPQKTVTVSGTTHRVYNARGMVTSSTDARGHVTTYEYAPNGVDRTAVIEGTGSSAYVAQSLVYDSTKRLVTSATVAVTASTARVTEYTYTSRGQAATITEAKGTPDERTRTLSYYPDNDSNVARRGRLASVSQGTLTLESYTYNDRGLVATKTDRNDYTLAFEYDDLNRRTRTIYPDGTFDEDQWGCCGIDRHTDREGRTTSFLYDKNSRLVLTRDPQGQYSRRKYDANGNLTQLVDGNGNVTRWDYDGRNRVSKKTYADGTFWTYEYDGAGNLRYQTDAKGQVTEYLYDANGNLTFVKTGTSKESTSTQVEFSYDDDNRRTQMVVSGAGMQTGTTAFTYRRDGSPETVDGPLANDTIQFGYDGLGRQTTRSIGGAGAVTAAFDPLDRVTSVVNPLGTFSYGYRDNASSLLTAETLPNGQAVTYSYGMVAEDLRLEQIWNKKPGGQTLSKFDYGYGVDGNILSWRQQADSATPEEWAFAYDAIGQLLGGVKKNTQTGAVTASAGYTYDAGGNRKSEVVGNLMTSDSHNAVNQITERQGGSGQIRISGTTDEDLSGIAVAGSSAALTGPRAFAGMVSVSGGSNTITVSATDTSGNATDKSYALTVSGSGGTSSAYDPNGNLLSKSAIADPQSQVSFTWDWANRLTAVTSGTNRSEFTYDGLGRRVQIVEKTNGSVTANRNFVWVGTEIAEERDGLTGEVVKRFCPQGVKVEQASSLLPAGSYFYARDHLGSLREVSDNSGALRARYDYDPYGRRTKLSGDLDADFGFTGHFEHARSGLTLALYRAYDADLGRWLSRDPGGNSSATRAELLPEGPNLYSYVGNSPTGRIDPAGLAAVCQFRKWHTKWGRWRRYKIVYAVCVCACPCPTLKVKLVQMHTETYWPIPSNPAPGAFDTGIWSEANAANAVADVVQDMINAARDGDGTDRGDGQRFCASLGCD